MPLDQSLCRDCNPLGLAQPAASQAHGTILLAILLSVAALAVLGRLTLGAVGPFSGSVVSVAEASAGLDVTIAVSNEGTSSGSATCRVFDRAEGGIGPDAAFLLSPKVPGGGSVTFTRHVAPPAGGIANLAVDCR